MPRQTRAALRAQASADIHTDADADLDTSTSTNTPVELTTTNDSDAENHARAPLGEIAMNEVDALTAQELDPIDLKTGMAPTGTVKKGRGRGRNKGGMKGGDGDRTAEATAGEQGEEPIEVGDVLMQVEEPTAEAKKVEEPQQPSPVKRTRSTRRTRATAKEDEISCTDVPTTDEKPTSLATDASEESESNQVDPVVNTAASIEAMELGSSEIQRHDALITEASTNEEEPPTKADSVLPLADIPLYSPSGKHLRPEDSIEAMDDLEDAIEAIGNAIPNLEVRNPAPEKRKSVSNSPAAKSPKPVSDIGHSSATKPLTPAARQPGQITPKGTTSVTRSTSTLLRSASTKAAPKPKAPLPSTSKSILTIKPKTSNTMPPGTKRRPISLQFPPAPGPIKSSKPPTQSTFTLPGEAIAAKLKAAREARLAAAEEEAKKRREFKARPVPKATAGTVTVHVRKTTASIARESMIRGEVSVAGNSRASSASRPSVAASGNGTIKPNTLKRASIAGVAIPPPRPAAKETIMKLTRPSSIAGAPATSITSTKRASTLLKTASTSSSATSTIAKRPSTLATKPRPTSTHLAPTPPTRRPSTVASNSSASGPSAASKPSVTATDLATQKVKAREIFNRDKVEKEDRERQRREKEDGARKARAEAAERGRLASREWAERQRLRALATGTGRKVEAMAN
ncbi:hypothetical protein P152DRAFT_484058 [Eremomyces bilateralis CBS 781.70]|uniref:Carboxylesterase family protein n=1 Tax=Eremomyces bilateralis CBS 781.70 TaxID=1392243 RepID=A0A6G1FWI7_9PEZI|nr:uncharacterized protein P152DRAFT_484058 [Eremomyces bilateralis CBS 781.70]KAF1810255.1 hypothetical protein P152DRAFT_484058 [Eremomyces bilateralis CBS 781.70]